MSWHKIEADQQSMTQHCPCAGQLRSDVTADPDSRAHLDRETTSDAVASLHNGDQTGALQ
jgi:hypothetical protein